MADFTSTLSNLSPKKRALFELLLKDEGVGQGSYNNITSRERSHTLLPSFAQQRLWFLDQLEPNSPLYNIYKVVRLKGVLDTKVLEKALNEIVRRHEALRTTFTTKDGSPAQVITESATVVVPVIDISSLKEAEREIESRRLATEEVRRHFDLSVDLMLRATLLRIGDEDYVFVFVLHHIASDGWSIGLLMRELTILYQAFLSGTSSPLPELPIQYADFALWQREWLQGEVLDNQLAYWKRQLDDAPALLELPADRPRSSVQTFVGAQAFLTLSEDLTRQLKALSQQEHVTLFMILLAAFKTFLHRYTNQNDIAIGSPIAGRTRIEVEPLIGLFVNTLVLRTDLSGNPTFRELLLRVRETALGAFAHQDVPFEKLVEELQPERNLSYTPFFQTMFALQNAPKQNLELPGVTQSHIDIESVAAKFDIVFFMTEKASTLHGRLEYNTDLFDARTIERMLHHFQVLLHGIVANPDRRLSELPLLIDAERQRLVVEWNDTKTDYPRARSIQELFEAQVERTPDAIAVVFERERLTYHELNRRANQLAHRLQQSGVKPGILVGICVERDLALIVGMLGILKAGGAYLPLDPTFPREHLAFMLEDTQTHLVVVQEILKASLPEHITRIVIDADKEKFDAQSEANLNVEAKAEDLAYVMYTSGSTGKPKGIAIGHRAVVRLVCETNYVQLGASDKIAQIANASFDAATFEIWGALLNGAKLVLMKKDVALSPRDFAQHLREHEITVMFLTTALFNQLVATVPEAFGSIKTLLFGGEAVDPKYVDALLKSSPPSRLLHVYGPTENTTFTSWYLVPDRLDETAAVPIGRPIANTQIYVLDSHHQPVPIGVAGELYIGGDGLAKGYVNRPELTAERFIPNPFSSEPPARLYKTGDRVRYAPDGNLEFLGRFDRQVKVRGFRIELEEIEALLNAHTLVRESVVMMREDEPGEKRLIAYVVPRTDTNAAAQPTTETQISGDDLRDYMKLRLPDYMIPAAFIILDSLPLTPNGKVNHRALPVPELTRNARESAFVAPRDPFEQQLTDIWEQVLGVSPISVYDNFFALGGHSLLAVRMVSMIENVCGKKLPLAELFADATIAHVAHFLLQRRDEKFQSHLVPVQPFGSRRPFFFLHGDFNGGGFYCSKLAEHLGDSQPLYAFQPHGLDSQQIPATIEEMAADYVETLREFQPEGPYLLGGFCHGGLVAFEMARLLQKQNQKVDSLILIYASATNVRFRFHHNLVRFVGDFLRSKPNTQLTWFLRLRKLSKGVNDLSRAEQISFLFNKARNFRTASNRNRAKAEHVEPSDASLAMPQRHSMDVLRKYSKAVNGYVPGKYSGSLNLFYSKKAYALHIADPSLGWRDAAASVTLHTVAGDHLTCITTHIQALAGQIKTCLDEVQNEVQDEVQARNPVGNS